MNGSKRWIALEIAAVAVVVLAVIGYLCGATAQQAGANGEVPGQGLLAKCAPPAWYNNLVLRMDVARYRRNPVLPIPPPLGIADSPMCWQVAGAGEAAADGAYHRVGEYSRYPYYRNVRGWYLWHLPTWMDAWALTPQLGAYKAGYTGTIGEVWKSDVYALAPAPQVTDLRRK